MKVASSADLDRLLELSAEFYEEAGFRLNRRRASEGFATLLDDDRLGRVWLIRNGGRDVGYLVLTFSFSMEFGGLAAVLDDLYVRAEFRGAGLGRAALDEMKGYCATHGFRAVYVESGHDNHAALALYRQAGFAETGRLHLTLSLADPAHAE